MTAVRAQDILILLKLIASGDGAERRQIDLASALDISQAEVHNALKRAAVAGFFVSGGPLIADSVRRHAISEFLVHGAKYVFPARLGEVTRGLPTAWGLPAVAKGFVVGSDDTPVWPWSEGTARGGAIQPLYKTAPQAAARDSVLHELLALLDSIRVGRVRDREAAAERLRKRLLL